MIFRRVLVYAARRVATDPRARDFASRTARTVANEARVIARDKEPLSAARQSFRRLADTVRNRRSDGGT